MMCPGCLGTIRQLDTDSLFLDVDARSSSSRMLDASGRSRLRRRAPYGRFHLSDGGWSPHARDDMLNSISGAELSELGYASSCWVELWSPIRQYLVGFPVPSHKLL